MSNKFLHHEYHAMFVSFFHAFERQAKPAEYKQFLDLIGGSFNPLTIHPSDVEVGNKPHRYTVDGDLANLTLGMFTFSLVMNEPKASSWRYHKNRVASTDPVCYMYVNTDLKHYAGSYGFTYSTTENLVLFDYREPAESFSAFIKGITAPIRREAANVLRAHKKYLADSAKYDKIQQILKIKV